MRQLAQLSAATGPHQPSPPVPLHAAASLHWSHLPTERQLFGTFTSPDRLHSRPGPSKAPGSPQAGVQALRTLSFTTYPYLRMVLGLVPSPSISFGRGALQNDTYTL